MLALLRFCIYSVTAVAAAGSPQPENKPCFVRTACLRHCPVIAALLAMFVLTDWSHARIVPPRDPREGVLDASLVVIVSKKQEGVFRIEETTLGQGKVGDTMNLTRLRRGL